jgi:hypothetical protein
MKNSILIILLVVGVSLFVILQKYTKEYHSSAEEPELSIMDFPTPRFIAPDFILSDLNGDDTRLNDYRGSLVLMMFWTTW